MIKDSFEKIFKDKQRILVVFSHPDDAEIFCGGTIARLISEGKEVLVIKMTSGNKGSRQQKISEQDLAALREKEDSQGMEILGVKPENNVSLGLGDGEVENDLTTIGLLALQIRTFKPDLIITHNPENVLIRYGKNENYVNHRDHRNTGKSVVDAAYPYARELLFFPEHFSDKNVTPHITVEFLFVDYWDHEDTIQIDITNFSDKRTQAIASHKSQYPQEAAQGSTDFFAPEENEKRFEKFRYVIVD